MFWKKYCNIFLQSKLTVFSSIEYGHMAFNSGATLSRPILKSYSGCNPKSCDPLLERHGMSEPSRSILIYASHLWRRRYVASTTYTAVDWHFILIISSLTWLHHPWWLEHCDAVGRPMCSATRWLTNNCTVYRPLGHVGESSLDDFSPHVTSIATFTYCSRWSRL
jgi:hypothetical protein